MGKDDRIDRLRAVPLFGSCTDDQLRFIETRVEEMDFPAGKVLTEEGTSGGEFFILLEGEAEVRRGGKPIATMKPGDFFGEIALLDNGPRTATVTTKTPIRSLVLSHRQFQDVIHQDGRIAATLLHVVTKRLRANAGLPDG
jgi:CRP/FNR family transcriptional regulator, cyclic AMP receptor protein